MDAKGLKIPKLPSIVGPKLFMLLGGVAALGLIVFMGFQVQSLKGKLLQSEREIGDLSVRNQDLTQQLDTLERERKKLDGRVSSLRGELASMSGELEKVRATFTNIQERFEKTSGENKSLEDRLSMLADERERDFKEIGRLTQERADLERTAVRLRERLRLLDRDYQRVAEKLAAIEAMPASTISTISASGPTQPVGKDGRTGASLRGDTVELPPIIVRKNQTGTSLPVRGRVVEINEPHRFVVVDKGSMDGVRVGMTFNIVRGAGSVIGRARVVRVRPQLAACDISRLQTSESLQVGDLVVQNSP